MKKGQMVETVIEKIGFPNKGVGLVDGEKFVVKNALPGQKVQAVCTKLHKGKGEGRLVSVLEKAPCEKESDCPHFGICGSCLYRTLPYEEQLRIKEQQVKDLLFAAAGEFPFEGIKGSPVETGYRNKMEFSFGDEYKDGPLTLGMHKRGSFYDVVFTEGCQIVDADYRRILRAVCLYFREKQIPYYHKTHVGFLRHLLVRKAAKTGEILVDLVTSSQTPDAWNPQEFARLLTELSYEGELVGVLHTTNDSVADVILNEKTDILYGRDFFLEELLGLSFKITPFSFFQTNSLGAEVLYDTVRGYVREAMKNLTGKGSLSENVTGDGPGDVTGDGPVSHFAKCDTGPSPVTSVPPATPFTVFDLYSGTGTIAQLLADAAEQVVGVEIVEEAVEAARENAAKNGLTNCRFLAGDVLKVIDELEEKPNLIVLDPPRDGIHPKALPKILAYQVPYMVYVSCKPTSLARDLPEILQAGYRIVKGCCVDMFPATSGVETIVLLQRLNS